MESLRIKNDVMLKLGTGLSVDNLCIACGISYNQLCELAQEYPELYHELKKWYKRYDFTPVAQEDNKEQDNSLNNKKKVARKGKKDTE